MKKILLYSDLHLQMSDTLGVGLQDSAQPWMTTRIQQKLDALTWVIDTAIVNKCKMVVDLGDLFTYINPPSKLRNAFSTVVYEAMNAGIRFVRIVGNHETDGREPDGLDVSILSDLNYLVVGEPLVDEGFLMIPEVDQTTIIKYLEDYPDLPILGHFGVRDALYPNGMKEHAGIPFDFLKSRKFPMWLGHIHLRQELGNVTYIGALCKHNFGDKDIPTGACMIEYDEQTGEIQHQFIDRPDIGLHRIVLTEADGWEILPKIKAGDVVKIVVEGSQEFISSMLKDIKEGKQRLLNEGAIKVLVEMKPVATDIEQVDVADFNSLDFRSLITQKAKMDGHPVEIALEYLEKAEESA